MTTDRDTTRRVRSWLQTDQHESADRVLQAVLDAVDTTPQRRASRWPAWRFPGMVTASKFGLASALVAVAALVGLNVVAPNGPLSALGGPRATTTPAAAVRPGESLIRIAGHDVSVVLPAGVAWRMPEDGDAGNGIAWGNNDTEYGHLGSRWTTWSLYAPDGIHDPTGYSLMAPLPEDPVAWLRQLRGLTVLAERDIEVGGQPARLLDVSSPGNANTFLYEVPVGDSGASSAFMEAGAPQGRYVIWQLGETWMVAQGMAVGVSALETADAPGDPFMQFVADLRFP